MNVLSLFDGISCGQLALQRAGVDVDNYFASEIDENALSVVRCHFPNTIQLGDVVNVRAVLLPKIDILLGASPCQGFSFIGKQLNFNDARSKLFFEYSRLLKECNPKYFLFENVNMKKEYKNVISEFLGVNPIEINSKLFSKQNRKRLYWTNIKIPDIVSVGENFDKYLYQLKRGWFVEEIKFYQKHPPLLAQSPATKHRLIIDIDMAMATDLSNVRKDKNISRPLTPEECEELQTIPIGYTSCLNKTARYKAIGNGWTIDVVAHILKGIKK